MGDKDRPSIGQRVRKERERRVWSQSDLARESGVQKTTISRIENGHHEPRQDTVRRLAGALGVEPRWLLSGVGRKAAQPADKGAGGAG